MKHTMIISNGRMIYRIGDREVTRDYWNKSFTTRPTNFAAGECPRIVVEENFSNENGGLGRQSPQLKRNIHDRSPDTFYTSTRDLIRKGAARGMHVEDVPNDDIDG